MLLQFNKIRIGVVLFLILIFGTLGIQAAEQIHHPFKDEMEMLVLLDVLPEKDWNPASWVTYRDYLTLIEDLFNGRSDINRIELTDKINIPDAYITYQEALSVVGMFLGYDKNQSYAKVKDLTKELKKSNNAQITGYDMAYIFYEILYSTRVGGSKTLLEERYVLGDREMIASRVMQIKDGKLVLEDKGAIPLALDVQAFHMVDDKVKPLSFSLISVGMDGLKLLFDKNGEVQSIILAEKYFPKVFVFS